LVVSDKVDAAQMKSPCVWRIKRLGGDQSDCQREGVDRDENDGVYYVKTKEEKESEPTESAFYTLSTQVPRKSFLFWPHSFRAMPPFL